MLTQTIAGFDITLQAGRRYRAEGDWRGGQVQIRDKATDEIAHTFDAGSPEARNEFVNAFNNGPTSFEGRVWGA